MTTPCVTVIVPTYRHSAYVLQSLASVFSQSFTDYEVIVINDGSPDDTGEVLRPLVQQGRIRYIEQANQGQSSARNRGLAEARGRYIALLDDDDIWPADKLGWQVEYLESTSDTVLIGGGAEIIDGAGTIVGRNVPAKPAYFVEDLFSGNPLESPGQTLVRTCHLRKVGGFRSDVWGAEDLCLYFDLARIGQLRIEPLIALRYRLHSANASRNVPRMFRNTWMVYQDQLRQLPRRHAAPLRRMARQSLYETFGRVLFRDIVGLKGASQMVWWQERKTAVRCALAWGFQDKTIRRQLVREVIRPRLRELLLGQVNISG